MTGTIHAGGGVSHGGSHEAKPLAKPSKQATLAPSHARRGELMDTSVPKQGNAKRARMNEGISALWCVRAARERRLEGVDYTFDEIAAWAGCTHASIEATFTRGLKQLRAALEAGDPVLRDLFVEFIERRQVAELVRTKTGAGTL